MTKRIKTHITPLLLLLLLTACADDRELLTATGAQDGEQPCIGLSVSLAQEPQATRSTYGIATTQDPPDSMLVWAFEGNKKEVMFNEARDDNGLMLTKANRWRSSVRWPLDGEALQLYALAPGVPEGMELNRGPKLNDQTFDFTYEVPDNVTEQRDLLYADTLFYSTPSKREEVTDSDHIIRIPITLHHLLTAIQFRQGYMPQGTRVKEINLMGIALNKGKFNVGGLPGDPWTEKTTTKPENGTSTYEIKTQYESEGNADYGTLISTDRTTNTMFMLPQTLGSDATLSVTVAVHDEENVYNESTVTSSLSGQTWKAGQHLTYYLTVGAIHRDYVLKLSKQQDHYAAYTGDDMETRGGYQIPIVRLTGRENDGAGITVCLCSYRQNIDYSDPEHPEGVTGPEHQQKATWFVEGFYSYDEETGLFAESAAKPAFLTKFTSGSGNNFQEYQPIAVDNYAPGTGGTEANAQRISVAVAVGSDEASAYVKLKQDKGNKELMVKVVRVTAG